MQDVRDRQPEKAAGYRELVGKFGAEKVGAAVLAKWISDPDADQKWEYLAAAINLAPRIAGADQPMSRPRKYWVILWYVSMGYENQAIADQLELGIESIKQELTYARLKLGLVGAPMPLVVATALRQGRIP